MDMTTGLFPAIVKAFGGCIALLSGRRSAAVHPDDEADERLVTVEEFAAEFDHLLIRKRLLTRAQRAVIDSGIRSHGVVTGVKATGAGREMQLDLMVTRPDGGQFPARGNRDDLRLCAVEDGTGQRNRRVLPACGPQHHRGSGTRRLISERHRRRS